MFIGETRLNANSAAISPSHPRMATLPWQPLQRAIGRPGCAAASAGSSLLLQTRTGRSGRLIVRDDHGISTFGHPCDRGACDEGRRQEPECLGLVGGSTVHHIACPPSPQEASAAWWRNGLVPPLNDAYAARTHPERGDGGAGSGP